MKDLQKIIKDRDNVQLSLLAQNHIEQKSDPIPKKAIVIFNDLFKQLRAIFPAMMANIHDQDQLDEMRRQWVKAIAENEIYHSDQIEAGMKRARQHEKPFLPSPGEFISWCKEGMTSRYGLPDPQDLYDSVMLFRAKRFQFRSVEDYPWQSDAEYWLVTKVSHKMTMLSLSVTDTLKSCEQEIKRLTKMLSKGFVIPEPIAQVEKHVIVSPPEVALSHLAKMKAMIKTRH